MVLFHPHEGGVRIGLGITVAPLARYFTVDNPELSINISWSDIIGCFELTLLKEVYPWIYELA